VISCVLNEQSDCAHINPTCQPWQVGWFLLQAGPTLAKDFPIVLPLVALRAAPSSREKAQEENTTKWESLLLALFDTEVSKAGIYSRGAASSRFVLLLTLPGSLDLA